MHPLARLLCRSLVKPQRQLLQEASEHRSERRSTHLGKLPCVPPPLAASLPHLRAFCSSAVAPHRKQLRLVPKHLWWLDQLLIMEFGHTIWVNIWLRTAETLNASEKNYAFFSINYYTTFLKLAFPGLFSLPIQILALLQSSAKSLLPQGACSNCPAHTVNPICIYSVPKCPLVTSQVQIQTPACSSHEVPSIPFHPWLNSTWMHITLYHTYFRTLLHWIISPWKSRIRSCSPLQASNNQFTSMRHVSVWRVKQKNKMHVYL